MFIGHFALAFASKKIAPRTSIGTMFLATQLPDLIWPTLVILGIERVEIAPGNTAFTPLAFLSYPWSHSLLALSVWGALLGAVYWLVRRDVRGSLILAGLVVSHWMLDALTHRPDMPLTPAGETVVGLGLWDHVGATLLVETLLFAAGVAIYLSVTRARRAAGSIVLWSLIAFLLLVYAGNVFGPPPPSVTVVAIAGHAIWLLVLWGWWADRLREPRAFG